MMRYLKYAGMALLLAVASMPAAAEERKAYIAVKSGFGGIEVKDEFAINGITEEQDMFSAGLLAGYTFDSGFVIEAGVTGGFSEDIFDSYDVSELVAMAGYTFRPATDITVVPKFGFSMWELDTFESGLFNFFGEDEERSFDGSDPLWSLEGEYSLNKLVQLNLSYTLGSYDFGDLDSFRFGVEFDF